MATFNKETAEKFSIKAKLEQYCINFTWYNQYLEVVYSIPMNKFLSLNTPQWTHVKSVTIVGENLRVVVGIFNDDRLYDVETALVHRIISFNTK